jgi:TonB family protein
MFMLRSSGCGILCGLEVPLLKSPLVLFFLTLVCVSACKAQAPAVNDEPINPPTIVYPASAKQKRIQGTVELEVHVSYAGRVTSVTATDGPDELRQAAVDAYQLATYKPLLRAGRPVPAIIHTKVDFSLHEAPPSPDDLVAKDFDPLHERCETMARDKAPDAIAICQQALETARRFTPTGHMVAHAVAYNDLALALLTQGKSKEAAAVGEEAVTVVADAYPGSLAAANAYITRAETRSRSGDLKRSMTDCSEAERILHGLIDQAAASLLAQDVKAQLKGVLRLHAVELRRTHQGAKAKTLEDEADKL